MESVNSFSSSVHSIIRAAGFRDLRPRLRQVLLGDSEEITAEHRHLNHHDSDGTGNIEAEDSGPHNSESEGRNQRDRHASESTSLIDDRRFSDASNSGFAPLRMAVSGGSLHRIEELARQRDENRAQMKDDEREPLLITKVRRDDGTEAEVIVGQSTLPQTIFNSSNTLVGVGILSLPLGIKYAGWVIGESC